MATRKRGKLPSRTRRVKSWIWKSSRKAVNGKSICDNSMIVGRRDMGGCLRPFFDNMQQMGIAVDNTATALAPFGPEFRKASQHDRTDYRRATLLTPRHRQRPGDHLPHQGTDHRARQPAC